MNGATKSRWVGGLAEWQSGETVYLSIAFTWKIPEAYQRAQFARAEGLRVVCGGPSLALNQNRERMAEVAEYKKDFPDAISRHNPMATFSSRGCDQDCPNCIVPFLEGRTFTLIPNFPLRPILCDNNLSFLPADYQEYVVKRYEQAGMPLLDANSGFEPILSGDRAHDCEMGTLRHLGLCLRTQTQQMLELWPRLRF